MRKDSKVQWGPFRLPSEAACEHFLFLGATGSGKSVLIKLLLRSVLEEDPLFPSGTRGIIYDAKGDLIPFLADCVGIERLLIMNPFDARAVAWDIAADATSQQAARQIANILVPSPESKSESDNFFLTGVRELITAAMIALRSKKGKAWTFRDLLLLMLSSEDLLEFLLKSDVFTAQRIAKTFLRDADERTRANILSTISASLGAYEPVADAWMKTKRKISMSEWVQRSNQLLVLGNDERYRSTIDPVNRALFQRVSEELLAQPEANVFHAQTGIGKCWVVLDEVREAGQLTGLRSLLNKGRSKGVCVVLGCQDVEGMRHVYGEYQANELLGQCAHTVVLNLSNPATAQWAVDSFGSEDVPVRSQSTSVGNNFSESASRSFERKSILTTREILEMPKIGPAQGMSGYFKSYYLARSDKMADRDLVSKYAPWKVAGTPMCDWPQIEPQIALTTGVAIPSFVQWRKQPDCIEPWSHKDRLRLGLSEQPNDSEKANPGLDSILSRRNPQR